MKTLKDRGFCWFKKVNWATNSFHSHILRHNQMKYNRLCMCLSSVVANWKLCWASSKSREQFVTEWDSRNKMTVTDKGNVKINSSGRGVGVRQKIRALSRKISTMERKDINGDIIKKIATFFVGVLFVSYSLRIFIHLFSLLYPSFQTTKAIQVWHFYLEFQFHLNFCWILEW